MRWMWVLALVACGGKDDGEGGGGPFDLDDYCQQTADCYNDYFSAYQPDTGPGFTYEPETCILQWEAQREQFAGGPCEGALAAVEDCIATAEHMVCVRGSYASGACTVESTDLSECLLEMVQ